MYVERRASQYLSAVGGEVISHDGTPFDRVAYSRFKYGYLPPAVEYGQRLAREIADPLFATVGAEPIRVVSAPYKHLPTASHAIAQVLVRELSQLAIDREVEPPVLVPFHKSRMGSSGYALSSEADRLRSLATLGLRIDESLIRDAHVLVVDDIRITGSAEKATADYLTSLGPRGVWYLHAAVFSEELGKSNPGIENELNQSTSHGFLDLLEDVDTGHFQLNTRVLRHILEYEESEFNNFLDCAPSWILRDMHGAALGNGLAYYTKYKSQLEALSSVLHNRQKEYIHASA